MQICGSQAAVFIQGKGWVWFHSYAEAAKVEAEELRKKVEEKLARGGTVIVTRDMYQQVEAVQRGAHDTALNQSAH